MAERNNVLNIQLNSCCCCETRHLYQYDYGQIIKFSGVTLPDLYEVHFANSKHGEAKTVLGNSDGVAIPDEYLETAAKIYGWIYLHTGEDDGETVYRFIIPVIGRAKPTHEEPSPVQQSEIEQLIAHLGNDAEAAEQSARDAQHYAELSEYNAGHAGYFFFEVNNEDGECYVTSSEELYDEARFAVNEQDGTLGVTVL
jgi:hypothetical protein